MKYEDKKYISTHDLSFKGILSDIKKSKNVLLPLFEAFTNALEAIKIRIKIQPEIEGNIIIRLYLKSTIDKNYKEFDYLSISDNGIGFNDEEFKRFNTYKDFSKGYKNFGSGRFQYLHYFDNTIISSVFCNNKIFFERKFSLSKNETYLKNKAIVYHEFCKKTDSSNLLTTISFHSLLETEKNNLYNDLTEIKLKNYLLDKYLPYFCYNKNNLPQIKIECYLDSSLMSESFISDKEIPTIDKETNIQIPYSFLAIDGKKIQHSDKKETFLISSFKIAHNTDHKNSLRFVSKGEIVDDFPISLLCFPESINFQGFYYFFLVASDYIDNRDSNTRGMLTIPKKKDFLQTPQLFTQEEILVEEIETEVNKSIIDMYPEILNLQIKHEDSIRKLQEMFGFDNETLKDAKININDNENKILEKIYQIEARKIANLDATIKKSIDNLDLLNTTSSDYNINLEKEINELVKNIPLQNKKTLTHYVARRKLVLELFDKIINKKLLIQQLNDRNNDEKLLHNLIFQQNNSLSETSDLWLVNEDFIFFNGISENQLKDVKYNGEYILRDNLTEEEYEYRISLNENRFSKRPDILLFPEEGKCIIIEFKNPEVNVSEHLNQISNYATLIWNFSKPQFKFTTFYGYLIGEKINSNDVRSHDGDFKNAYQFDYLFRPHKIIPGFFQNEGKDASLYTEVIKYSTLLARAKRRNTIFTQKLSE